ncbi:hypothetical protein FC18_GL002172 [Lacticaseibacillus sharpeae JCM 1186 = DSM 20505]|uniref:Uncharacterized protein n=1 Tax=Lacticaseibacillus sharpeae JCM 1186 = DSM 20505 TaxID=1291052 RepID=A0A0R1ZSR9_9LACO|nr:hypothetical protein FC18_GL002172 [Lacticaseibacillus sharpeae JCM 1186 = DSM 20505]
MMPLFASTAAVAAGLLILIYQTEHDYGLPVPVNWKFLIISGIKKRLGHHYPNR